MKLYLVRHGQSMGNLNKKHQNLHTPLSAEGLKQAEKIAKKLKNLPIDVIISSHYARAHKTAEIIAKEIGKPIEINEELREIKNPKEVEGKLFLDDKVIKIFEMIRENIHDPNWHYSDEENPHDLIKRARRIIKMMEKRKEENILAVSHGRIIQTIVGAMIFGDMFDWKIYQKIKEKLFFTNTGITVVEFTNDRWGLVTWNDNTHVISKV